MRLIFKIWRHVTPHDVFLIIIFDDFLNTMR